MFHSFLPVISNSVCLYFHLSVALHSYLSVQRTLSSHCGLLFQTSRISAKLWPHPVSALDFQVENGILSEHKSDHDSQVHSLHPSSAFIRSLKFPPVNSHTHRSSATLQFLLHTGRYIVSSFGTFPLQRATFSPDTCVSLLCASFLLVIPTISFPNLSWVLMLSTRLILFLSLYLSSICLPDYHCLVSIALCLSSSSLLAQLASNGTD